MSNRVVHRLNFTRKAALAVAGVAALAVPIVVGHMNAPFRPCSIEHTTGTGCAFDACLRCGVGEAGIGA